MKFALFGAVLDCCWVAPGKSIGASFSEKKSGTEEALKVERRYGIWDHSLTIVEPWKDGIKCDLLVSESWKRQTWIGCWQGCQTRTKICGGQHSHKGVMLSLHMVF